MLRRLFEPLGYEIEAIRHPLDEKFPEWGESPYFTVTLKGTTRLSELLTHLYVLIPVLDDEKHYLVRDAEVESCCATGKAGFGSIRNESSITNRYLKHQRRLAREALSRLIGEEEPEADELAEARAREEEVIEKPISLAEQRMGAVMAALRGVGAKRVVDLGCGEGRLLRELLKDKAFTEIVGVDVSHRALDIASQKLRLEDLPRMQKERIRLIHGSLTYRDKRLAGFDAATVVEVIEHQDPARLAAFERVLFEFARPQTVVVTTPNVEYNVKFETLPAGKMRHKDHRFEWTRSQFQTWAHGVAEQFGYAVRFLPIGPEDCSSRQPHTYGYLRPKMKLTIPELAVVALVGPSGSGKSSFARKHFRATEVLSSDFCRGLVSDEENNQAATNDAFEVLHFIASKRLAAGKLVVIDATNVQPEARKPIVALAREYHALPVAIAFDLPEKLCHERNRDRPDRNFGPHVVRQQSRQLRNALRLLEREGFRRVHILRSPEEVAAAEIVREPLWNNLKHEHGAFSTSSAMCTAASMN